MSVDVILRPVKDGEDEKPLTGKVESRRLVGRLLSSEETEEHHVADRAHRGDDPLSLEHGGVVREGGRDEGVLGTDQHDDELVAAASPPERRAGLAARVQTLKDPLQGLHLRGQRHDGRVD